MSKKNVARDGLHMLYVTWAARHLTLIDKIQQELGDQSNMNLMDMQEAIKSERDKLVKNIPAYYDAQTIINEIGKVENAQTS